MTHEYALEKDDNNTGWWLLWQAGPDSRWSRIARFTNFPRAKQTLKQLQTNQPKEP